jgi:aldehyde:ferredoxin oxidoreductase
MAMLTRPRAQHLHQDTYFPAGEDIHKDTYWPEYKRTLNDLKRDAKRLEASEKEIAEIFTDDGFDIARLEKLAEDGHAVWNALGMCDSGAHWVWDAPRNISQLSDFYSSATGFQITPRELRTKGEMIWNMERLLNVREGWTREIEEIPKAWIHMMENPIRLRTGDRYFIDWLNRRVSKEDIVKWLDDYYIEREWDKRLGIPTVEKLKSLGLDDFIEVVEPFFK